MSISTHSRHNSPEIMDDLTMEGPLLLKNLDEIESINKRLGGHHPIKKGVSTLIKNHSDSTEIHIADIGCGNGGTLRMLHKYAQQKNWKLKLTGIDANPNTIDYARSLSKKYDGMTYKCQNILEPTFQHEQYDIILCTLTLHHFSDQEIIQVMDSFYNKVTTGVIINDLHRSKWAYNLFYIIARVFRFSPMAKEDGALSILRGFKKAELIRFAKALNFKKYTIHWKWAFRYQWIIYK